MNTKSIPLLLVTLLACFTSVRAEESCTCGMKPASSTVVSDSQDAPKGHPLKGVVVSVLADKSALLVKHEEIPGVMKAMTMLLKVDAEALKAVRAGDAVTGLLVRKADGWWLDAVAKAP